MKVPETMKAIVGTKLGPVGEAVELSDSMPVPQITKPTQMLVRVHACSFSPGDPRRIRGDVDLIFKPKGKYVIGMDICGTVVEAGKEATFKVGDCIMSSDDTFLNGCAEYAIMESAYSYLKPESLSPVEASCLPNSAQRAMIAIRGSGFKKGDRVMVLGGSGGFGTFLVQMLKQQGAGYIAATSTQLDLVKSLGADKVYNYEEEKWWEVPEYKENQFDVVFDCAGGYWDVTKKNKVLKTKGMFVAVAPKNFRMQIHSVGGMIGFMLPEMSKVLMTKLNPFVHPYKMFLTGGSKTEELKKINKMVEDGLRVVLDGDSPFEFTTEGARAALLKQESYHAHGKVVIKISEDTTTVS